MHCLRPGTMFTTLHSIYNLNELLAAEACDHIHNTPFYLYVTNGTNKLECLFGGVVMLPATA